MENDRAKQLIVSLLQQSLIGHLDPSSNYKPQDTADAIIDKVNFEKSYADIKHEHLIKDIMAARLTMMYEMEKLTSEQTLLKNFICGKLAAYDEVLDILNK
jgi:hypothetical protein